MNNKFCPGNGSCGSTGCRCNQPSQQTPEAKTLRDEVWKAIVGYENEPDPEQVLEAVMIVVSEMAKGCLEVVPEKDIRVVGYYSIMGWNECRQSLLSYFRSKGVEVKEK